MIRREAATPEAAGARWILISQMDHARLSAALAEHWGAEPIAPLVSRDELLWAIEHHDDGWAEWEQSPDVEPKFARPRSFTEMDLPDGLEIWASSITRAAEHGPLAGYVVAGHFCALSRRYDTPWRVDRRHAADAERFLATYDSLMEGCLQAWQARSPADHTPRHAHQALEQLQLFDSLSLWLCCDEATSPDEFQTPEGPVVTLAPLGRLPDGAIRVAISPWPLTVRRLNLEIPGRAVAVRRYRDRADLAAAPAEKVQLRWQLEPGKSKS